MVSATGAMATDGQWSLSGGSVGAGRSRRLGDDAGCLAQVAQDGVEVIVVV
ncbi:MAG: hypothetical protein ABJA34_08860 [Pseudonocardiales bacterium]